MQGLSEDVILSECMNHVVQQCADHLVCMLLPNVGLHTAGAAMERQVDVSQQAYRLTQHISFARHA